MKLKYGALTLNLMRTDAAPGYLFSFFFNFMYGLSFGLMGCNPSVQALIQIYMSLGNLLFVEQHLPKRETG
jgi:hypothetical protein